MKDQIIREQADYLDEYRIELMHLRGDKSNKQPPKSPKKCKDPSKEDESVSDNVLECSRAFSEEEDTWSLPG